MKLIRTCMFALAVLLPTSWTLAHAGEGGEKSGGEMKKEGKKKKKDEKKEGGDMGDMKKGDMDKK